MFLFIVNHTFFLDRLIVASWFEGHVLVDRFTNFSTKVCDISLVSAGVSVTSSNTGVPDISGSVYTKTQVITQFWMI